MTIQQKAIKFAPNNRDAIISSINANIQMCYTCNSCTSECPVNIATGRLAPVKLIRMVNLGLIEELMHIPEIWYCLTCGFCNHICPNDVSPCSLVKYLRKEMLKLKIVSYEKAAQYKELYNKFNLSRWQFIYDNIPKSDKAIKINIASVDKNFKDLVCDESKYPTNILSCLSCSGCTNVCPLCSEDINIFNPMEIFYLANLGQKEELIKSPSIWLCFKCQSCTQYCNRGVKGHLIINALQELAFKEGVVNSDFEHKLKDANKIIYSKYLEEVDKLFL